VTAKGCIGRAAGRRRGTGKRVGRRPMQPFAVTLLPPEYSPALPPLARRPNPQPPPIPCILWVLPLPARPRIALGSPAKTNPIPPLWTRSPQLAASRRHLLPAPFGRTGPPRPPKSTIYRTKPISARRQNPPAAPNPTYSLGVTSICPAQDRAQPAHRTNPISPLRPRSPRPTASRRHLRAANHLDIIEQGMFRPWILS